MAQTSYDLNQRIAFAGLKVDSEFDTVESFAASEEIQFGYGLRANSSDPANVVDRVANAADVFRGISLHQHNAYGKYNDTDTVNTLRRGKAWVQVNANVAVDAAAYVDPADGKFTSNAVGTVATGGTFRSAHTYDGGATDNLAQVEINLP